MELKKKLSKSHKKQMLVDLIHLSLLTGHDPRNFVGNPLSYFDFAKVFRVLKKYDAEHTAQGGYSLFEFGTEYTTGNGE